MLHVNWAPLVGEAGIPCDHKQPPKAGQRRDDIFHDTVRKEFLLRVTTHIRERQNGYRGFIGKRKSRSLNGANCNALVWSDPVSPHRLSNVLHGLLTAIHENHRQFLADVVTGRARHANAARFSERLKSGRDVDAIAKEVRALYQHVSNMHADAEAHLLIRRLLAILRAERPLHIYGALDRVHDARKLGEHAIPRRVEDAAAMLSDQPVNDLAVRRERAQRADFVDAHEATVALDIGGEDRGELAFDLGRVHLHQEGWPVVECSSDPAYRDSVPTRERERVLGELRGVRR